MSVSSKSCGWPKGWLYQNSFRHWRSQGTWYAVDLHNVIRKRWNGYRPDGSEWLVAQEDSLILSLLRRVIGQFLPLMRTNFIILKPDHGGKVASHPVTLLGVTLCCLALLGTAWFLVPRLLG